MTKKLSVNEVNNLLSTADPVSGLPEMLHLDERAKSDYQTIVNSYWDRTDGRVTPPMKPTRKTLLLVGSVAAGVALLTLAVTLGLPRLGTTPAYAATPPPLVYEPLTGTNDAAGSLNALADRVAVLPNEDGSGRYSYTERSEWSLYTTVLGEQVTSEVVPVQSQMWLSEDGSGRSIETSQPPGDNRRSDVLYQAGRRSVRLPFRGVSSDLKLLEKQLGPQHPGTNGPAERLVSISDLYSQMPVMAQARSAVLRYLAATPDLTLAGAVTDRAGRRGVGYYVESSYAGLPTRYTLIVDPNNGQLLAREDMLLTTAGKLNVQVPATISYTLFLNSKYTDELK
jgi:hypothetical protein